MSERDIDLMLFGSRTCTVCGNPFPANTEHFRVDRARVDGLTGACKSCRSRADQDYWRRNPAKYAEKKRRMCEYQRERRAAAS